MRLINSAVGGRRQNEAAGRITPAGDRCIWFDLIKTRDGDPIRSDWPSKMRPLTESANVSAISGRSTYRSVAGCRCPLGAAAAVDAPGLVWSEAIGVSLGCLFVRSGQSSSPKRVSMSVAKASTTSAASRPVASTVIEVPGEAASIIRPMIEVPPTVSPPRMTRTSASNFSTSCTNFADARACSPCDCRCRVCGQLRRRETPDRQACFRRRVERVRSFSAQHAAGDGHALFPVSCVAAIALRHADTSREPWRSRRLSGYDACTRPCLWARNKTEMARLDGVKKNGVTDCLVAIVAVDVLIASIIPWRAPLYRCHSDGDGFDSTSWLIRCRRLPEPDSQLLPWVMWQFQDDWNT